MTMTLALLFTALVGLVASAPKLANGLKLA